MTTCSRAGGCAGSRYPFLTQKERDVETQLDYFLARYYSSTQGRFTSPDEFTGGPDELYYFVDDASENPTFYADLSNPQSLNKYQYAYNNPLRYIDPDGHEAENTEPDQQQQQGTQPAPPPKPYGLQPWTEKHTYERMRTNELNYQCKQSGLCSDVKVEVVPDPNYRPPDITQPVPIPEPQLPKPPPPAPRAPASPTAASHRSNRRKSNKPKHQGGTRRKQLDKGGEKADPRRKGMPFHKKRPDNWKGPWPPKPKPPKPDPRKPPTPSKPSHPKGHQS